MNLKEGLSRFRAYLKKDTWDSWLVSLVLIIILIKFIIFPLLSLLTGTALPLVVIESCSMYHESSYNNWWESNSEWYNSHSITKEQFDKFSFNRGLNKGDIILLWGYSDYKLGDILIFKPNSDATAPYPIIHRIISLNPLATKGDHNPTQLSKSNNSPGVDETSIAQDQMVGKAIVRIPYLGWIKLIFFDIFKPAEQRGLCH